MVRRGSAVEIIVEGWGKMQAAATMNRGLFYSFCDTDGPGLSF